jgi:hypothetical protein
MGTKIAKKKAMPCKIAFLQLRNKKNYVQKCDLRLAKMRWEIDVAELFQN